MKTVMKNEYNLKDRDINETEVRVKMILVNDKKEVLLGYSANKYQFIGGHVEEQESLIETAQREILEETGISLELNQEMKPVAKYIGYWKDRPEKNKNKKTEIYYYMLNCNEKINYNKTNYTEEEKKGNFELRYIPLLNLENEIIQNYNKYSDAKGIGTEMLQIIKEIDIKNNIDKL